VNRWASPRLAMLLALAFVGIGAALALREPLLVVLASPPVAVLALGVAAHRWSDPEFTVSAVPARVIEGDELDLVIEVRSAATVPWLDLELTLPPALRSLDGARRAVVALPAGTTRRIRFPVVAERWGVASPSHLRIEARDRFGLFCASRVQSVHANVRVYPRDARLRSLLTGVRTGQSLGAHLAVDRGDGCEFAETRPFRPGDRTRSVNWRVSARRRQLWVTERHPERQTDVVLLVDGTVAIGERDTSLRRAVQAASQIADAHLGVHDRVGVCAVGQRVRWLRPGLGARQLYDVVDTLLDAQSAPGGRLSPSALSALRTLPGGTSVVALSALADAGTVEALADLRRRAHDVVVVVTPLDGLLPDESGPSDEVARRIWELERHVVRRRLVAAGVPVVDWSDERPLAAALALLGRRRARRSA